MTMEEKSWKPTIFLWFFLFFSKGIADYITRCKQAIGKFESLVHQIHKNADDISSRLTLIESINLFKYPAPKSEDELPGRADFLFLWLWKEREKPLGHGGTHTCTDGIKPYLTISGLYLKRSWMIATFHHVLCVVYIVLQIPESMNISSRFFVVVVF